MLTPTTRRQHNRASLRYETDLTDAEWAVIASLMPEAASRGRPPIWTMRQVLNAIFYVLRGGIAWRLIPKDLPPRSTTFGYFARWRDEGLFGRINHLEFVRWTMTAGAADPAEEAFYDPATRMQGAADLTLGLRTMSTEVIVAEADPSPA